MCLHFTGTHYLGVGGDVTKSHSSKTGACEVESSDVGLAVRDTPGVIQIVLVGQQRHPASENKKYL